MNSRQRLTEIAHSRWQSFLAEGSLAIDATAGNGYDTAFLARSVGETGKVLSMDIQQCAIDATRERLQKENLLGRVRLLREDHSRIRDIAGCDTAGRAALICFNLGYLPSGDHSVATAAASTLVALQQSLLLLNPVGALSVIAYRGHAGALEEAQVVERFFNSLPSPWRCIEHLPTGTGEHPGPVLWMASSSS